MEQHDGLAPAATARRPSQPEQEQPAAEQRGTGDGDRSHVEAGARQLCAGRSGLCRAGVRVLLRGSGGRLLSRRGGARARVAEPIPLRARVRRRAAGLLLLGQRVGVLLVAGALGERRRRERVLRRSGRARAARWRECAAQSGGKRTWAGSYRPTRRSPTAHASSPPSSPSTASAVRRQVKPAARRRPARPAARARVRARRRAGERPRSPARHRGRSGARRPRRSVAAPRGRRPPPASRPPSPPGRAGRSPRTGTAWPGRLRPRRGRAGRRPAGSRASALRYSPRGMYGRLEPASTTSRPSAASCGAIRSSNARFLREACPCPRPGRTVGPGRGAGAAARGRAASRSGRPPPAGWWPHGHGRSGTAREICPATTSEVVITRRARRASRGSAKRCQRA